SEGTLFEDQISASETRDEFKISNEYKDLEEAGSAGSGGQGHTSDMDHDLPEMQGQFGLGREEAEEQTFKADSEPTQESSSQSRELTVEEENDPEKLNNGEPRMELEQGPEAQFDSETPEFSSVLEEQYELVSESENTLKPQATGWFGGGFTSYLCFGEEDAGLELLSKEHNLPLQDVPNSVSTDEEAPAPCREVSADKEDTVINDSSIPSPTWFVFGFGILGFAYANEDKSISDDGKRKVGETENHKHPIVNDLDPGKEQESRMITVVETEDQTGKESALEKTDGSDSMQYLKKFFYNLWSFQSLPEDTELPFSTKMLDQDISLKVTKL
ncbi:Melanoma inhibitory activity protein 2, partial [Lemmus lemmus]